MKPVGQLFPLDSYIIRIVHNGGIQPESLIRRRCFHRVVWKPRYLNLLTITGDYDTLI